MLKVIFAFLISSGILFILLWNAREVFKIIREYPIPVLVLFTAMAFALAFLGLIVYI